MKYLKWIPLLILTLSLFFGLSYFAHGKYSANPYGDPFRIRCTCYSYTGSKCANGEYPVQGLSVAGKKEWLGKTCIMYESDKDGNRGAFIGYFEFTDTGYGIDVPNSDKGTIQLGKSIDVYRDTLEGCEEWIARYGDYVYIQVIDAEG